MSIKVEQIESIDMCAWDQYVSNHPDATCYQLSAWRRSIENSYGHKAYYLMAVERGNSLCRRRTEVSRFQQETEKKSVTSSLPRLPCSSGRWYWGRWEPSYRGKSCLTTNPIVGILPLFHIKHFVFGNALVSLPFCDYGGVLADNEQTKNILLEEAIKLCHDLHAETLELHHINPINLSNNHESELITRSHKVRMQLRLPENSEVLFQTFKSKLRSQIRKPEKEGLHFQIGGAELLDTFYSVFSENMRDLGSPVHAKSFVQSVIDEFQGKAKLGVVWNGAMPIAAGVIIAFRDTVFIPWASSLRKYNRLSPNMMLYWNFLKYAADSGHKIFDFGRSTPGEGTYKFKKQWGSESIPLHWQYWSLNGNKEIGMDSENPKYQSAIEAWQKLPLPIATWLGPKIRKHIWL